LSVSRRLESQGLEGGEVGRGWGGVGCKECGRGEGEKEGECCGKRNRRVGEEGGESGGEVGKDGALSG